MKQEDKSLLLKDLCARLPYNTHLFTNSKHHIRLLTISRDLDYDEQYWINGLYDIDEVKPYLRPMSSMTDEEATEYANCGSIIAISHQNDYLIPNPKSINWLLEHHFDYQGLIEKGLAIEAPDGMYKIKKNKRYDR